MIGGLWAWSRSRGGSTSSGGAAFEFPSFLTGRKLTNAPAGADGYVRTSPADLSRQAGLEITAYTLARFVASEWGSGTARERAVIAVSIVNRSRKTGTSILTLATRVCHRGSGCEVTGLYGMQGMPAGGGNRYASTRVDPTDRDAYVASMVLANAWPDITGGADQFFNPSVQRAMHLQRGDPTPEEILASWTSSGNREAFVPPGIDPDKLIVIRDRA